MPQSAPVGRTHLGRMAAPVWQEDAFVRGALEKLTPEQRAAVVERVNQQLAQLKEI